MGYELESPFVEKQFVSFGKTKFSLFLLLVVVVVAVVAVSVVAVVAVVAVVVVVVVVVAVAVVFATRFEHRFAWALVLEDPAGTKTRLNFTFWDIDMPLENLRVPWLFYTTENYPPRILT